MKQNRNKNMVYNGEGDFIDMRVIRLISPEKEALRAACARPYFFFRSLDKGINERSGNMAQRKYYMTIRFKTAEDFDKHIGQIYDSGYKHGFKDGRVNALSYFQEVFDDEFTNAEITSAAYELRQRRVQKFKKEMEKLEDQKRYLKKKLTEEIKAESSEGS